MIFQIGDIKYSWLNWYKTWFTSADKNLPIGTTRFLGGKMFYVDHNRDNRTYWIPVEKDYELVEMTDPMHGNKYMGEQIDKTIREKWFVENVLRKD